jgi:two-component system response regulator FixJ
VNEPTVFIVDDDQAVARSLRWLIESVRLRVETFCSAQAFIDGYDAAKPGCLVLDVRMPGMSGLELQERLAAQRIHIPIIFITGHGDVQMAVRAVQAGAFDFVEKPFNDQDLLDRIQRAITRDAEWRDRDLQQARLRALFATLTPRETEVLDLVVEGLSNKAVANALGLSAKTVEVHRAKVMEKMHARSLSDLVKMAMQRQPADAGNVRKLGFAPAQHAQQRRKKHIGIKRLGQEIVHSRLEAPRFVLRESIRRHGDDRNLLAADHLANPPRRIQPVHVRHLHVHQYRRIGRPARRFDGLGAIACGIHGQSGRFQVQPRNLPVDRFVIDRQDALPGVALAQCRLGRARGKRRCRHFGPASPFFRRAVNQNVLPAPGVLSAPTSPPINSARRRLMANPSPVPPYRRVVELSACSKAPNSLESASGAIPIPVSSTENSSSAESGFLPRS